MLTITDAQENSAICGARPFEAEIAALGDLREKPAGTVRITATEYAAYAILLPRLAKLLRDYPDIKVEIAVDYGLTDIVAQRYDAGVRSPPFDTRFYIVTNGATK